MRTTLNENEYLYLRFLVANMFGFVDTVHVHTYQCLLRLFYPTYNVYGPYFEYIMLLFDPVLMKHFKLKSNIGQMLEMGH